MGDFVSLFILYRMKKTNKTGYFIFGSRGPRPRHMAVSKIESGTSTLPPPISIRQSVLGEIFSWVGPGQRLPFRRHEIFFFFGFLFMIFVRMLSKRPRIYYKFLFFNHQKGPFTLSKRKEDF